MCKMGGFYPSSEKLEQLLLISLENDSYSSFDPTFPPSLPNIWIFHPHKNYIFEIGNNRGIRWKSFIIFIFKIVNLVSV